MSNRVSGCQKEYSYLAGQNQPKATNSCPSKDLEKSHAADAGRAGNRHRSAVEDAGVGGRIGRHLALPQRSGLDREAARTRRRERSRGEGNGGGAGRNSARGGRFSLAPRSG